MQFLLLGIVRSSKILIIAHLRLCLDIFEGERFNKHSENMGLKAVLIESFKTFDQ